MSDVTPPEPPQFDPPAEPAPAPPPPAPPVSMAPPAAPMTAAPTYVAMAAEPQPPAPYATWIRRVGGYLIDSLIVGIPSTILLTWGFVWGLSTVHTLCADNQDGGTTCIALPGSHFSTGGLIPIFLGFLVILGWYIYVVVAIGGKSGATVGMKAFKLRCVRADTFDQVGTGRSFGRLAMNFVFSIISCVGLVDDLFPLWDAKRQTLHDKVVSTVVLFEG